MQQNSGLTTAPISQLLRQIAIPASIGFFFNTMYNVVDTYFGGLISTQALAALSLSFPVFFIVIACGHGVSTGTTALIGSALGASEVKEARLFAIQGISFGLLMSLALTGLGLYGAPFAFSVLGASGDYLRDCLLYTDTIFKGAIFFILIAMLNSILNARGDTKTYRNFLILGFCLNVLLDPWFIYGGFGVPAMGITGIALATVFVQIIGCGYIGFKVYRTGVLAGAKVQDFLPRLSPFKEIARQGVPSSLNFMTIALGTFVITYFVSKFGKEAVAAYGIGLRVEQIVFLPAIGLNIASLSIIAQNNGARLFDRIIETRNQALKSGGIIMGIGTVLVFIFAKYLMSVFTDDLTVIQVGITYLRVDSLVLYAYVVVFINIAVLQGMKRPMFGMVIGVYRLFIAPLTVFYIVTEIFNFGLLGLWWSFFFITWSAAFIAFFYTWRVLKSIVEKH